MGQSGEDCIRWMGIQPVCIGDVVEVQVGKRVYMGRVVAIRRGGVLIQDSDGRYVAVALGKASTITVYPRS